MSLHHSLQLLKCFGVGLGATVLAVCGAILFFLFLNWAEKKGKRISLWFKDHERLTSWIQIVFAIVLVIGVLFLITQWGCSILGVK